MFFRKRKEMQSLIDESRRALREAEDKIYERNKLLQNQTEEIKQLKGKVTDLENNVELLFNNLSPKKRELVLPELKTNSKLN